MTDAPLTIDSSVWAPITYTDPWDVPSLPIPDLITRPHQLAGYLVGRMLSYEYRAFRENRRLRLMKRRAHLEFAAREAWERNNIRRRTAMGETRG